MAYQWVMGDSYGGLNSAGEQAGQNAASNWFRQAQMVQGLDQQARAEAEASQQGQEQAAKFAWTQQQAGIDRAAQARAENLGERKFQWDMTRESLGSKNLKYRDSWDLTKQLMPLADEGTLTDEQLKGLLPEHQDALKAHRDAARTAIEKEQGDLAKAGADVGQEAMLKHYVSQSQADVPGYVTTRKPFGWIAGPTPGENRYDQRQRMLDVQIPAWQEQLSNLSPSITPERRKLASILPVDPDTGYPMTPPPLPWARRTMAAPVTAAARPAALPPHIQQTLQNARVAIQANPAAKMAILKRLSDNGIDPNLL